MKNLLLLLCIIILVTGNNSCQFHRRKLETERIVTKWYNKEIAIPDSVFAIKDTIPVILKKDPLNPKKLKIITLIPANCEKCIFDVYAWCSFLDSINKSSSVDFIPIFKTSDPNQFVKLYLPILPYGIEPYLDSYNKFLTKYRLPNDLRFRTFLLDKNNKIILLGNPIYSSNIKSLYIKKIIENG